MYLQIEYKIYSVALLIRIPGDYLYIFELHFAYKLSPSVLWEDNSNNSK